MKTHKVHPVPPWRVEVEDKPVPKMFDAELKPLVKYALKVFSRKDYKHLWFVSQHGVRWNLGAALSAVVEQKN